MLHMLGIQAGVKIHHGLKGSQATVEEQEQQLELSVGGTVRESLLQETQTLPHHVLIACGTQRRTCHKYSDTHTGTTEGEEPQRGRSHRGGGALTSLCPQVDINMSSHQTVHVRKLQLGLQSSIPCEQEKNKKTNSHFSTRGKRSPSGE